MYLLNITRRMTVRTLWRAVLAVCGCLALLAVSGQAVQAQTPDGAHGSADLRRPDIVNGCWSLEFGVPFTQTIQIGANFGPDVATNAVMNYRLPSQFSLLGMAPNCQQESSDAPITCHLGSLEPGYLPGSIDFFLLPTSDGVFSPEIWMSSDVPDPDLTNNMYGLNCSVLPEHLIDLEATILDDHQGHLYVDSAKPFTLTVKVRNLGDTPAPGTTLHLNHTTAFDVAAGPSFCAPGWTEGIYVCDLGETPAGADEDIDIVLRSRWLTGTAMVSAELSTTGDDLHSYNDVDDVEMRIYSSVPDLEISHYAVTSSTPLYEGGSVRYGIGTNLHGAQSPMNLLITQTLPAEATVEYVSQGCYHDPARHTVTCRGNELQESWPVYKSGSVTVRFDEPGEYHSLAEVTGDFSEPEQDLSNNASIISVRVLASPGGVAGFARSGGRGLAGIEVSAMQEVTNPCPGWREVETTTTRFGDGGYALSYLDPGVYIFRFHDPTGYYADRYYAGATGPAGATRVTIESNTIIVDIDVNMQQASQAADQADPLAAATANHYLPLIATCWQR